METEVIEPIPEEKKKEITERIVTEWNNLVNNVQNTTIKLCLKIKEILGDYPECTVKEILDRVSKHPEVKQFVSIQRIWQGLRLVKNRPDLIEYVKKDDNEKKDLGFHQRPYLKKDGEVFWEFYFELEKAPFDPMKKKMIEQEAKDEFWSFRELRKKIQEYKDELVSPPGEQAMRKRLKRELIKEVSSIMRKFTVEELEELKAKALEIKEGSNGQGQT